MTYSIVACDQATGQLGVGIQSHFFAVGRVVRCIRPGVGVIATQAFINPSYGPAGFDLMQGGASAPEALRQLVNADGGAEMRQVAILDVQGRVATHTGRDCYPEAGDAMAEGASAQGNMLREPGIPNAMIEAFQQAGGDLADRIHVALDAGEACGGDARGRQSAALAVVSCEAPVLPGTGVLAPSHGQASTTWGFSRVNSGCRVVASSGRRLSCPAR